MKLNGQVHLSGVGWGGRGGGVELERQNQGHRLRPSIHGDQFALQWHSQEPKREMISLSLHVCLFSSSIHTILSLETHADVTNVLKGYLRKRRLRLLRLRHIQIYSWR